MTCLGNTATPSTAGQCVPASEITCATDGGVNKQFCPSDALANNGTCVDSCGACTGYTADASTCAVPNATTCADDGGKSFCPVTGLCVSNCTACPGNTATPSTAGQCVP